MNKNNLSISEEFCKNLYGDPLETPTTPHVFVPEPPYPGSNSNFCCRIDGLCGDMTHVCGRVEDDPIHLTGLDRDEALRREGAVAALRWACEQFEDEGMGRIVIIIETKANLIESGEVTPWKQ